MLDARNIYIRTHQMSLLDLVNSINPEHKYSDYASPCAGVEYKTQIVESLFVRIPCKSVWRCWNNGVLEILDGYIFLLACKEFLNNEFALTGVSFIAEFEGKKFSDMHRSMQRRIEETMIDVSDAGPGTPISIKDYLFNLLHLRTI